MSRDGKRNWVTPPRRCGFRTIEDIRGVVVVGDAGDVAAGVLEYYNRGFDHFTFDVRNQFDRFEETLEAISGSVLPIVRTEIARANVHNKPIGGVRRWESSIMDKLRSNYLGVVEKLGRQPRRRSRSSLRFGRDPRET